MQTIQKPAKFSFLNEPVPYNVKSFCFLFSVCEHQINKNRLGTYCHKYAVIKERASARETVVCGGEQREKVVYISAGNVVEITITSYSSPKKAAHFLLKYEGMLYREIMLDMISIPGFSVSM